MSLPIVICDDSTFAQKSMARSLPDDWDVDITYASNGQQAIDKIEKGLGHVLFLDLNMPIMDGYETLELIREYDLQTMVIVVSGDVQAEARKRVLGLGAIDFIEKPVDNAKLTSILTKYGIFEGDASSSNRQTQMQTGSSRIDKLDVFREMCNIAMGRAGKNLATILGTFIDLPVPNIDIINSNELSMAIAEVDKNSNVSAVSKGFVSLGVRGEAIILYNDTQVKSLQGLLGYEKNGDTSDLEVLMDISNIIVGACLSGIAKQLNLELTHTTPIILGMHCGLEDMVSKNTGRWDEVVMVEIAYSVSKADVNFELLLLLPVSSMDAAFSILTKQGERIA
ncbi:response regulator [Glaciecola sp. 2405UD65-10]|uniref:response regulator n=1 Tax=Glaciecola sp. 2405UD65-10 TaxID=3397244 RepID=UPI003B5C67B1